MELKNNPYTEVKKIFDAASEVAEYISNKTKIDYELIYFEEIFFFYCLNNISLSINDMPMELIVRIKSSLLKALSLSKLQKYNEYKDVIEILLSFRTKNYLDLLLKYSEKFTIDFFQSAFIYQSELIVFIKQNNSLMQPKTKPSVFSEYIKQAAQNKDYKKISKLFEKQFALILDFIAPAKIIV